MHSLLMVIAIKHDSRFSRANDENVRWGNGPIAGL
jgi:hypothetical protein